MPDDNVTPAPAALHPPPEDPFEHFTLVDGVIREFGLMPRGESLARTIRGALEDMESRGKVGPAPQEAAPGALPQHPLVKCRWCEREYQSGGSLIDHVLAMHRPQCLEFFEAGDAAVRRMRGEQPAPTAPPLSGDEREAADALAHECDRVADMLSAMGPPPSVSNVPGLLAIAAKRYRDAIWGKPTPASPAPPLSGDERKARDIVYECPECHYQEGAGHEAGCENGYGIDPRMVRRKAEPTPASPAPVPVRCNHQRWKNAAASPALFCELPKGHDGIHRWGSWTWPWEEPASPAPGADDPCRNGHDLVADAATPDAAWCMRCGAHNPLPREKAEPTAAPAGPVEGRTTAQIDVLFSLGKTLLIHAGFGNYLGEWNAKMEAARVLDQERAAGRDGGRS